MKKRVLRSLAGALIFAAFTLPSCEDCGQCELVTEYADGTVEVGTAFIYCGEAYDDLANSDVTDNGDGSSSYWNCY